MIKLLIEALDGKQYIIEVGVGGSYAGDGKVLWDERIDGKMPSGTDGANLHGWVKQGTALVLDAAKLATAKAKLDAEKSARDADKLARDARKLRLKAIDSAATASELKSLLKDLLTEQGLI